MLTRCAALGISRASLLQSQLRYDRNEEVFFGSIRIDLATEQEAGLSGNASYNHALFLGTTEPVAGQSITPGNQSGSNSLSWTTSTLVTGGSASWSVGGSVTYTGLVDAAGDPIIDYGGD